MSVRTYRLIGRDRRPYRSVTPGTFGGHRGTRIYGRLDCPTALRAIARGGYTKDRVFFADEQTAIAAGYRPCAVCLPREYAQFEARRRRASALGVPRRSLGNHTGVRGGN